jgi:DNA repair protein RadD
MASLPLFDEQATAKPLRAHQHKAMAQLKRSLLAGNKRVVVQMPTGAGKTRLAAEIVSGALAKGNRVAFTVPMISLVDQTVEAFEAEGIDAIGVIQASHPRTHYGMPVQVCSVQSLVKRARPEADVIVVDECHLRFKVVSQWIADQPDKVFVGLSATPWARGMSDDWQDLVIPVTTQELIDAGFLSPFRVYAPSHPDLSGVKTQAGDYHEGQLAEVMSDAVLVADVVQTWKRLAESRPTLVFAVDLAHAAKLQAEFASAGVPMGYCDAHVDLVERKLLFDRMSRGELAGIVNVGTLTTGVDADVRCVVLARPTKSEMLHVQIIGRGLRTAPGKSDCLVLDHASNHTRLGFVTDIRHSALLDGKGKNPTRQEKGEPLPRECKACGALRPPKVRECPACGFAPERQSEIETEDGELIEITQGKLPKKPEATLAEKQRWYSELLGIAKQRGRSPGWAFHSYRKRFGKGPPNSLAKLPIEPSPEVISYARSLDIAFAKSRHGGRA